MCFQVLFLNTEKVKKVKETVMLKNSVSGVESYSSLFQKYFQFGKDKNVRKGQPSHVLSKDPSQFPYKVHVCLRLASFCPLFPF